MLRLITAAISIAMIFSVNAAPPVGVGGEEGSLSYTNNLKAPGYTITSLGGVNSRIETGNTNLLMNPSFEHTTVTTGWTVSNATPSAEATNVVEGKKSLKMVLTAALTAYQDSTINAAQISGLQGVAAIKIKTSDVSGLKVCARNAGVTSSTLCVNIPADSTWKHISIPFIMTATSNGIAITSTGTSGTVYIDDAFVGTSAPFQNVNGAKLVGTLTYVTATNCRWSVSNTSNWTNFAADTDCSTPVVTGSVLAPSTKIPGFDLPAGSPSGDYLIITTGAFFNSGASSGIVNLRISDGTNVTKPSVQAYTSNSIGGNVSGQISYSTSLNSRTTFQLQTLNSASGVTDIINSDTGLSLSFQVYYFPPESKIYSQASQDYDWTAYTPTFTGFGTVTGSECYHKREGSDLLLRCKFASGTSTATEARVSLPSGLTSASTSFIPTIATSGVATFNQAVAKAFYVLMEPAVSYVTFSVQSSALNGLTKLNGNSLMSSGEVLSFNARIPIKDWSDYGVIVGSFAGLEKCANDYECTDTFSARVSSTGAVSNENIDWINGNCSVNGTTGDVTCPIVSGVFNEAAGGNCNVTPIMASGVNGTMSTVSSSTSSQVIFKTNRHDATIILGDVIINCSKQGVDYKPKTAKVASSIGVPTVPGITTQAIDTFSFSYGTTNATTVCSASPCSYLDQIGTIVSSITRSATGQYSINLSKTYTKLKCSAAVAGAVTVIQNQALSCSSCSTASFSTVNLSNSLTDSYGTITCQGSY